MTRPRLRCVEMRLDGPLLARPDHEGARRSLIVEHGLGRSDAAFLVRVVEGCADNLGRVAMLGACWIHWPPQQASDWLRAHGWM